MKRIVLVLLICCLATGNLLASPLQITGSFESTISSTMEEPYELGNKNELYLNLDKFTGQTGMHIGIRGNSTYPASNDGFTLDLDEGYIDYFGEDFDFRLGKQRISWGTAVEFNPTDVVNPVSFQDPFGDKVAILAAQLDYYLTHNFKVTGVWIPFFEPAIEIPNKMEPTLEESEYALKLSAMGFNGFDVSVSYFNGKEDFPYPPHAPTSYRSVQIYGADMATTIGDFGFWAEGAFIQPDVGADYHHWIVGSDYSFPNGLIIAGQYYHRDDDRGQHNYLITGLEKDFASIHSGKVGLMYNIDHSSYLLKPEITFSLADATVLILGAQYFGKEEASLGMPILRKDDEVNKVYATVRINF